MSLKASFHKPLVLCVAVCLSAVAILCTFGGVSTVIAEKRKTPVYSVDRTDNKVAISFDAAWGADKTSEIMDICESYGVKATFFLVGFWVDNYPEKVKEIDNRGFEIGTHSATHPKMSTLTAEKMQQELTTSVSKITAITGKSVTLFRPPFGDYNNKLITCCEDLALMPIQWSVDSLDWKGISAKEIATRLQKMKSGDIILCHNNSDHIVEALPLIFEIAKTKGLTFVTIGELVYNSNYTIDSQGVQHLTN